MRHTSTALCFLIALALGTWSAPAGRASSSVMASLARPATAGAMARLSLAFEPNRGQAGPEARFIAHSAGGMVEVGTSGISLVPASPSRLPAWAVRGHRPGADVRPRTQPDPISVMFPGARLTDIRPGRRLHGHVNYLIGPNPRRWLRDLPTYASLTIHNVYPHTNLTVEGAGGALRYRWRVAPGGEPRRIALCLRRQTVGGQVAAWPGARTALAEALEGRAVKAAVHPAGGGCSRLLLPGRTDRDTLLVQPSPGFATAFGGSDTARALAIAVDNKGASYVTGDTNSPDFPQVHPLPSSHAVLAENSPAFVTKLSPDGTAVEYSTYLGGTGGDVGNGIAVDATGSAYVAGTTFSTDFPTVHALQPVSHSACPDEAEHPACSQVWVARLNPTGDSLIYSTYLGGSQAQVGMALAIDGQGAAYVTGATDSPDFPVVNPYQAHLTPLESEVARDSGNAFVARIDPTGARLDYSTYLGGSIGDEGQGIAVDSAGSAVVTGWTRDDDVPQPRDTDRQDYDAFVTRFSPAGNTLQYNLRLGGTANDIGIDVAMDGAGNAYTTGWTASTDFPGLTGFQTVNHGGEGDAYIAKIGPAGSLLAGTLLGGSGVDEGFGVAVDPAGAVLVAGDTASADLPLREPLQSANGGGKDMFVAQFSPGLDALEMSTYLGGSDDDQAEGIALDRVGNLYVAGWTDSPNFPAGGARLQPMGNEAAVVVRIGNASLATATPTPTSTSTPTATPVHRAKRCKKGYHRVHGKCRKIKRKR